MGALRIYPELEPARSREIVLARLKMLAEAYGRVDIPDIPLGKPSIFSPILAVLAHGMYGVDVIAHLRTQDHNIISLKSIIKTLLYAGIRRILLLRGDPPQQGKPCEGTWEPEDAVTYAQGYGAEAGLLISPRKTDEKILARARVQADYYYVTRVSKSSLPRILRVASIIKNEAPESKLAAYIVIQTEKNRGYLESYNIPSIHAHELPEIAEALENAGFTRIIISAPGHSDILHSREILEDLERAGLLR
jgi:hypothetical protein